MPRNGFASLVKQRSKKTPKGKPVKRRKLDDYETPPEGTAVLLRYHRFRGPIDEPACGSGRMVKALRRAGYTVAGRDIKQGHDFLKCFKRTRANIVTNPPYRDKLAELFCRKALQLADGEVAMLVNAGFVFGRRRANGLYKDFKPAKVISCSDRILFFIGGGKRRIKSQFFNHVWVVWPNRKKRKTNKHTDFIWDNEGNSK